MKKTDKNTKEFLLEINTEELPAGYVKSACRNLAEELDREFTSRCVPMNKPGNDSMKSFANKNSLIVLVRGLYARQEPYDEEITGPPKRIAFDKDGKPTGIALGFAKKTGVKIDELRIKSTPKGEYVFIKKKNKPRLTKDILKEIVPEAIKNISFPKTMRWDESGLRFARPIRSVAVLLGSENIPVGLGEVEQRRIRSSSPGKYLSDKKEIIDWAERKEKIRKLIESELKKESADKKIDGALLEEITFMVNSPNTFTGKYSEEFLELPPDVLKASMAKHQRIFPVFKKGKITNRFIAVIESGKKRDTKAIKRNYENILEAKPKDSLFFLKEDTAKPFASGSSQLKDLIFQKDLGTMFEKTGRVKELCGFLCDRISENGSLKNVTQRAAELSKIDLTSHMVGEFPGLQGIMGGEYALRSGESGDVAAAIREQYLPQGSDDGMPAGMPGAMLAVSDKTDNLVGFAGMGIDKIKGSFDPFGIRRNALGIIRIMREKAFRIDFAELIDRAVSAYDKKLRVHPADFKKKLLNYLKERINNEMGDIRPLELKQAVLESGPLDVYDVFRRKDILFGMKDERCFLEAAKIVERTANILKGTKSRIEEVVRAELLKEDLEKKVYKAYRDSKDSINKSIDDEDYAKVTELYAKTFYKVLHEFFDNVLVNDKDDSLRKNRLALMKAINSLYTDKVADLSKLPQIIVK